MVDFLCFSGGKLFIKQAPNFMHPNEKVFNKESVDNSSIHWFSDYCLKIVDSF